VEGDLRSRGINVRLGARDDSWGMPDITRGLGLPANPMYPSDDSYEANILWDEDESRSPGEESSSESSDSRVGDDGAERASRSGGEFLDVQEENSETLEHDGQRYFSWWVGWDGWYWVAIRRDSHGCMCVWGGGVRYCSPCPVLLCKLQQVRLAWCQIWQK